MVIASRPLVLLLLFALASCARVPTPADTSADVEAIRAQVSRATDINNAGDAAAWTDLFADGAIVMPDGEPEISGRQALDAYARRWFDQFNVQIVIEPVEIEAAGDRAFVRTSVTGSLVPKAGGAPVPVNDKEIAIFRRQADGAWQVWRLIGNSNTRGRGGSMSTDVSSINATLEEYVAAVNAADPAAYGRTLTDDVVWMPPDSPRLIGREAVVAWATASSTRSALSSQAPSTTIHVCGSEALATGSFSVALTPKSGGKQIRTTGKFMDVFRKQPDGSWKYAQAIFNFEKPLE